MGFVPRLKLPLLSWGKSPRPWPCIWETLCLQLARYRWLYKIYDPKTGNTDDASEVIAH